MLASDSQATRVGAAISVILIAAIIAVLRVDFGDVGPSIEVRVYMRHPGPLRARADVQLAGRKIGRVDAVRLLTANQARDPKHPLHPRGGVVLDVQVKKKYVPWVRLNSEVFVNAKGLIGESYLEIAPPPASEEMLRPVQDNDRVRGIDPARMEDIIVTSFLNAKRFGALIKELEPDSDALRVDLTELQKTLGELVPDELAADETSLGGAISTAASEFNKVRSTVSSASKAGMPSPAVLRRTGRKLGGRTRRDVASLSLALSTLSSEIRRVRSGLPHGVADKFEVAIARAKQAIVRLEGTIANVEELASRVASGIGTVGALMNDKEFSDDAKKLGRYIKRHPWELVSRPIDN